MVHCLSVLFVEGRPVLNKEVQAWTGASSCELRLQLLLLFAAIEVKHWYHKIIVYPELEGFKNTLGHLLN